jgi:hypothetical protein
MDFLRGEMHRSLPLVVVLIFSVLGMLRSPLPVMVLGSMSCSVPLQTVILYFATSCDVGICLYYCVKLEETQHMLIILGEEHGLGRMIGLIK